MINRSFKEVLEDAFIDLDYIPRDFLVSVDSKSSSESLVENKNKNIQERGVLTPGRKPTEPPSKVVNQNNIGNTPARRRKQIKILIIAFTHKRDENRSA